MAEYIEREAALRAGKRFLAHHIDGVVRNHAHLDYETCNPTEFARGYEQGAMYGINAAIAIPAADVAPVVHGEWVVCGDGENVPWVCSHCGKTTAHKYKTMYGKYCPNCGARMDGE